jgi:hypothetical protein
MWVRAIKYNAEVCLVGLLTEYTPSFEHLHHMRILEGDHSAFLADMPLHVGWSVKRALRANCHLISKLADVSDAAMLTAADAAAMSRWEEGDVGDPEESPNWWEELNGLHDQLIFSWPEWAVNPLEGILFHVAVLGADLDATLVPRHLTEDDSTDLDEALEAMQPLRQWIESARPVFGDPVIELLLGKERRRVVAAALLPAHVSRGSMFRQEQGQQLRSSSPGSDAGAAGDRVIFGELWRSRDLFRCVLQHVA